MKRSQYLKVLNVEEWKLREASSLGAPLEKKEEVSSKTSPILCYILSFGTLKLCFHEVDKILWQEDFIPSQAAI